MVSETKLIVRYAETDQMGIVHHSVYPVWFEAGRTDFIKLAAISYSQIEEKGLLLPLLSLKVNYSGYALYEDEIVVKTSMHMFTGTRITFLYRVEKQGRIITEGTTGHVWTNASLKPVNLKKKSADLHDALYKLYDKEYGEVSR